MLYQMMLMIENIDKLKLQYKHVHHDTSSVLEYVNQLQYVSGFIIIFSWVTNKSMPYALWQNQARKKA
jgi:hypothetical protein